MSQNDGQLNLFDNNSLCNNDGPKTDNKTNDELYCYSCVICGKESEYLPEEVLDSGTPKGFVFDLSYGMICKPCHKKGAIRQ